MLKFTNCQILRGGRLQWDDLWVDTRNGTIVDPLHHFYASKDSEHFHAERVVDCKGKIVCPGFIDLQFNGGYGLDYSNMEQMLSNPEKIEECAESLLSTGVTGFCPTLISMKAEEYKKIIPLFNEWTGEGRKGALNLGLHLEGPFFSKRKIGAHPLENIREPAAESVEQVYGADNLAGVRIVTMAPEINGALDAINKLAIHPSLSFKKGNGKRVVSIGHSAASLEEADNGINAGATMITHLFNAMGAFHHRDPGIIGLLGLPKYREKVYYGIIADGFHAHPSSVTMAWQSHPEGAVLVTDAMCGLGLPYGTYTLGAQKVEIKVAKLDQEVGKKVVLQGTDTLAGAIVTMIECVRNFYRFTKCDLAQALEAATLKPAQVIGISESKGTLNFGADADLVLLDPETLEVDSTYVSGKCVFEK